MNIRSVVLREVANTDKQTNADITSLAEVKLNRIMIVIFSHGKTAMFIHSRSAEEVQMSPVVLHLHAAVHGSFSLQLHFFCTAWYNGT